MAASYPGTLKTFLTHVNTTEVIDASHMNDVQSEVVALQAAVGTNPHTSTAGAGSSLGAWSGASRTYLTLGDRLANIEAGMYADNKSMYVRFGEIETITGQKTFTSGDTLFGSGATGSATGRVILRSGTTGGESSVQWRNGDVPRWTLYRNGGESVLYLRDMVNVRQHVTYTPGATLAASLTTFHGSTTVQGNEVVDGTFRATGAATFSTDATVGGNLTVAGTVSSTAGFASGAPSASAVADVGSQGTATTVSRSDHKHAREAWGNTPAAVVVAGTGMAGMEQTVAHGDHSHGLSVGTPGTSAVGHAVSAGSATTVARSDHQHGREAFGATTTSLTVGLTGAVGTALTPARSDHTHTMPAAGAPAASAVGDAAVTGVAATVALSDHKHAREAFGAAPPSVVLDAASAVGIAGTPARSDHNHGLTAAAPGASAPGDSALEGTSTSVARSDHTHGREVFGPAPVTNLSPQVGGGSAGVAVTPSRSDHAHPTAAPIAPATSNPGDAAVVGTSGSFAPGDHKHAREAFSTTATSVDGTASGGGAAAAVSRGDHRHTVVFGSVVAETGFGGAATDGAATALARSDHRHGTPPAPTATSVGALPITGGTLTGSVAVRSTGTAGYVGMQSGSPSNTGYVEFHSASAFRQGYIGFSSTTAAQDLGTIPYVAGTHLFTGTLSVQSGSIFEAGARVYSPNNPPPIAAPAVPLAFHVGGQVGTGLKAPKFIAGVNMTLRRSLSIMNGGSATYQIYVNGGAVSGAAVTANTTLLTHDFADVNINAGDRVQLNVNSVSGADAAELSVTVDAVTR